MPVDRLAFGYAALVACGGVVGFVKAGSIASLVAGLFFGGLAGFGSYQMSHNPKNVWLFLGASGMLAGIMGFRFLTSGKFMPAGLAATASVLMLLKVGLARLWKSQEP